MNNGELIRLTEMMYSKAEPGELLRLYLFDVMGYHRGAVYFTRQPKEPDEITVEKAQALVEGHINRRLEVRITNGGDFLVFHSQAGAILYPPDHKDFWEKLK